MCYLEQRFKLFLNHLTHLHIELVCVLTGLFSEAHDGCWQKGRDPNKQSYFTNVELKKQHL